MKGWKRSEQGDMAQLAEFLEREEYRCVTLSEHLLQLFSFRGTTCRMRSKSTQECWIHYGETEDGNGGITINGIAVMNSNGAAWCLLPREGDETADLAGKFDVTGRLASLSGPEEDAERLRASIARIPLSVGHYSLMRSTIGTQAQFQPAGIRIRRASMRDIVAVCSLHAAYEEEELPKAPRHLMPSLPERMAGLLKRQVVVLAFLEGRLAGKANTNARGLRTDQLGGIYVKPDERKKGIGTFMVGNLVTMLRNGNRDVCLYVRLDNGAARRIYGKLGFVDAGSYAALHF